MDIGTVEGWVKMIENHGAMVVFAVVSAFINVFFVSALIRGNLVTRTVYDKSEEDRDRLQAIMDKDLENFKRPVLTLLTGLQKDGDMKEAGPHV